MKTSFVILAALLGLILVGSSNSFAAMDMFMNIPASGSFAGIPGDSLATGHQNQISISSYSFGCSSHTAITGGITQASKPNCQDITISKTTDKSSPLLFKQLVKGETIPQVQIILDKANAATSSPVSFLTLTLTDAFVTSYQTGSSSGSDVPTESLSFAYSKIQYEFTPSSNTGVPGTPISVTYDLATNTVS